jgi:hypothetical protein
MLPFENWLAVKKRIARMLFTLERGIERDGSNHCHERSSGPR